MTLMATHGGLRGRPGEGLTPEAIQRVVAGLVAFLERRRLPLSVAVARDSRPSGQALAGHVVTSLTAAGAEVVDLGVAATPAAKLAARRRALGGAAIVTGSHLGPQWNGVKLISAPHYIPVDVRDLPTSPRSPRGPGCVHHEPGAVGEHVEAVYAQVDSARIRAARLTVAATGGVGDAASALLDRLGCRVAERGFDLGLDLDPDADRLTLVDEQAVRLDPEATLPLVGRALGARSVVRGTDTSSTVDRVVGGPAHLVPPGELHLAQGLMRTGADLAGEGNGGVIVPAVGLARDGLAAAAAVLELVARTGRRLSALSRELPHRPVRRSTLAISPHCGRALAALAEREGVDYGDPYAGVGVRRPNGAWGLVRLSATEALVRITTEAPRAAQAAALHDELRAAVGGP
jgi:phosphomannomutase